MNVKIGQTSFTLSSFESALIIDSDGTSLSLIKNYLTSAGIAKIDIFLEGAPALRNVEIYNYDIIVLDWKVKSPPAKDFYNAIRSSKRNSSTPIVLISGFVTKEDMKLCINDKLTRFLVKPFTEEIIVELIKKLGISSAAISNWDDNLLSENSRDDFLNFSDDAISPKEGLGQYIDKNAKPKPENTPHLIKGSDQATDFEIAQTSASSKSFDINANSSTSGEFEFSHVEKNDVHQDVAITREKLSQSDISKLAGESSNKGKITSFKNDDLRIHPQNNLQKVPQNKKVISQFKIFGREYDVFAPEKILVVDGDVAIHGLMGSYLKGLVTTDPLCMTEATLADKELAENKYDLVIMDWKQTGISGLTLYNRLRSRLINKETPIIVLSGLVKKEDFRILAENSNTQFIGKPTEIKQFQETALKIITSARENVIAAEHIETILNHINHQPAEIMRFAKNAASVSQNPSVYLNSLGGILARKNQILMAERVFKLVMEKDAKNITAMTELSKIYHRSGRHNEAEELLSTAIVLSPDSIERLCLLGEIGLTLKDTDRARAFFQSALKIDHEDVKANAGLQLSDNMSSHIKTVDSDNGLLSKSLASTLNTIGISLIKRQDIEKGIEQYKAAMCFVYDDETLAKLHFNLALAYLRQNNKPEAIKWFLTSKSLGGETHTRADKYLMDQVIKK